MDAAAPAPAAGVAAPAPAAAATFASRPSTLPGLDQAPVALPIVLAAVGALVGALLWGGVASLTGCEIGYVAWAVGGLAGGGAVLAGGRGTVVAAAAAAMALLGIACGKLYGGHLIVDQQLAALDSLLDRGAYERMRELAQRDEAPPAAPGGEAALAAVESAELVDAAGAGGWHGDDDCGEPLSAEEQQRIAAACAVAAAAHDEQMQRLRDPSYTYEQWREAQRAAVREQVPVAELVRESLGPIDVLFVLLGICTAFGLVRRATG